MRKKDVSKVVYTGPEFYLGDKIKVIVFRNCWVEFRRIPEEFLTAGMSKICKKKVIYRPRRRLPRPQMRKFSFRKPILALPF